MKNYTLADIKLCGLPLYIREGQSKEIAIKMYELVNGTNQTLLVNNFTCVFFCDDTFVYQYKNESLGFGVMELGNTNHFVDSIEEAEKLISGEENRYTAIEQPSDELIDGELCFQLLDVSGMDCIGEYITRKDVMNITDAKAWFKFDEI